MDYGVEMILLAISCICLVLAVILCHPAVKGYVLPLWKRITRWGLIVLAVLNLGWDIFIYKDIYEDLDPPKSTLAIQLDGLAKFPDLHNMTSQEMDYWQQEQIRRGRMDPRRTSFDQQQILYFNQTFANTFGIKEAKRLSYQQRREMMADYIDQLNSGSINIIFEESFNPHSYGSLGDEIDNNLKYETWSKYSDAPVALKLQILQDTARSLYVENSKSLERMKIYKISIYIAIFFILAALGIYTLLSKPLGGSISIRVLKVVILIMLLVNLYVCTHPTWEVRTVCTVLEIVFMVGMIAVKVKRASVKLEENQDNKASLQYSPS